MSLDLFSVESRLLFFFLFCLVCRFKAWRLSQLLFVILLQSKKKEK